MTAQRPFLRELPDGRHISAVSFGCSSLWAQVRFDKGVALRLLDVAMEGGINYFATGPSYGNGEAERRLGEWLRSQATNVLVSTSVGSAFDDSGRAFRSFLAPDMEASLTASLRRLGRERVDVLYLHGPSASDLNDEVFRYLEREKERGRVVWTGVNSIDPQVIDASVDAPIDAVMLQFNIDDRSNAQFLPRLSSSRKIVVSGPAMARAIYSLSTFVPSNRCRAWYLLRAVKSDPAFLFRGSMLARRMHHFTDEDSASVALRYSVAQPYLHTSVFGTVNCGHMRANIAAARREFDDEELRKLRSFH